MPRKKIPIALNIITELWNQAISLTQKVTPYETEFTTTEFSSIKSDRHIRFIPQDGVFVDPKVFENTSAGERALIILIITQMKKYNVLWHFDYRSEDIKGSSQERALLALRKKKILYKTETTSMHIVNPFFLRRGGLDKVIAASNLLIRQENPLKKTHFKNLESPKKSNKDLYTDSTLPNFRSNQI